MLNNLFAAGIFPPEVSAEALSASVFATLAANGYTAFNLVAGEAIAKHGFNRNSAGPFGQDIWTPWEDADTFLYTLASAFLGWRDIHASRTVLPEHRPSDYAILLRQAKAIPRYLVTLLRCSLQDFAGAIGAKLSWRR